MKRNHLEKPRRPAQIACGTVLALSQLLLLPALPMVAAAQPTLKQVVVLSRHGVRTATQSGNDNQAANPWPVWVEPSNFLTPTGGLFMQALGRIYSKTYFELVFRGAPCPAAGSVYVWADNVERTVETAQSLLKGFNPAGCATIPVKFLLSSKTDPLFHPVTAEAKDFPAPGSLPGVLPSSPGQGAAAVVATIAGQGPSSMQLASIFHGLGDTNFINEFAAIEKALGCSPGCVQSLPIAITAGADGSTSQSGSLATASSASEAFMLEYADGWPPNQIAWGNLGSDPTAIQANLELMLNLHVDAYKLVQRNPVVGAMQASNLANEVVQIFNQTAKVPGPCPQAQTPCTPCPQKVVEGAELCPPSTAPLVFIVGHDTNIGTLGGMLGMGWDLTPYGLPADDMPPGGALVFELWQSSPPSAKWSVIGRFFTPTMQGFGDAPACTSNPTRCVGVSQVTFAGCTNPNACTLGEFQAVVQKQSNPYFTFANWTPKASSR